MTQLRDIGFLCPIPDFMQESPLIQDHTVQGAGEAQGLFPTHRLQNL